MSYKFKMDKIELKVGEIANVCTHFKVTQLSRVHLTVGARRLHRTEIGEWVSQ